MTASQGTSPTVAFALGSLGGGGAERVTLTLLRNWGDPKPKLIVGTDAGPLTAEVPDGVEVTVLSRRWPSPVAFVPALIALRRALRGVDVVVVQTTGMRFLVLLVRALHLTRSRVVLVEQNTPTQERSRQPALLRTLAGVSLGVLHRYAAAHVAVSEGAARSLEEALGLPQGSVSVIKNAVDQQAIVQAAGEPPEPRIAQQFLSLARPVVLNVGRLVEAKDHATLLRAFALLPEGSLVVLGEGELRDDLEDLAHELGVADRVWMPGFLPNPWWFMANSDVFCLSSRWEGFGLVIAEALACGLPVVSTNCPSGPAEVLSTVESSRVVPVGDPVALAEAMSQVLAASTTPAAPGSSDDGALSQCVAAYHSLTREVWQPH